MISVVMTIYNVEKYIENAIKSVLNQTYDDIELILVDDCSTDNSINIVNTFSDSRIKLLHNDVNKGAGYSRKIGIESAKGDYVITIDSDDWVESNFLQNLYSASTNSDMTFGGMTVDFEDGSPSEYLCKTTGIFTGINKFNPVLDKHLLFLNNCLVKKHLYDKVSYDTKRFNEDTPTMVKLIYYANQINIIPEFGYHYIQHNKSLCHSTDEFVKHLCLLLTTVDLIEFFDSKPIEYRNLVKLNDIFLHMSYLKDLEKIQNNQDQFNEAMLGVINRIRVN